MSEAANVLLFSTIGNGGNAASAVDYIAAYSKHSRHNFYCHNFVYELKETFDLTPFDVIVIAHNFWPEILTPAQRQKIAQSRALKVLFLQDEYQYLRHINGYMAELGIDLMFSCVAEKDFDKFYPKSLIPSLREVHASLTGYVPDYLTDPKLHRPGRRRYDIGYRSRVSPYFLGKIGREKLVIAQRFSQLAAENGFTANISVHEEDRLYGQSWIGFLQSCRTQLGTPSGSSIVDMDGSVIEAEAAYRAQNPHATFDEVWQLILAPHDGKLVIDTISPRIFEYAAAGATMVLHEGEYGGLLEPNHHYIPVKKDYSNISDVTAQIADRRFCERMAEQAYQDLIASRRFSYQSFVQRFDAILDANLPHGDRIAIDGDSFYSAQAENHDQALMFTRDGPQLMATERGKAIARGQRRSRALARMPGLGAALRRTGGDPPSKWRKGRTAIALAQQIAAFRRLFGPALLLERPASSRPERLLKDVLLLGIIKSAQSGHIAYGQPFHVVARHELTHQRLLLWAKSTELAAPVAAADVIDKGHAEPEAFWPGLARAFAAGEVRSVVLDLSTVYPLQKFSNTTRLFWIMRQNVELFRSAEDEYYHLRGLAHLGRKRPLPVVNALRHALLPASGTELEGLKKLFS